MKPNLSACLQQTAALHRQLCPRQVLGVRIGLYGGELLQLEVPRTDKRLFVVLETDGCFADGVMVTTGCRLGQRTLRLIDHGKVAATLVDTARMQAIRLAPHPAARERAHSYVQSAVDRWHAYLEAYQQMPSMELLVWQEVQMTISLAAVIGQAETHVICAVCREEISNQREVYIDERPVCRHCAGDHYFATQG